MWHCPPTVPVVPPPPVVVPEPPVTVDVLATVQHCEAVCECTLTRVLRMTNGHGRAMQIQHLRDCADICTLTAKYIARESMFSRPTAVLCAQICEECGRHCLMHPDPESQHCGRVCLHCAEVCRLYAGMAPMPPTPMPV